MTKPVCSEQEFIALLKEHRSPSRVAKILNVDVRNVQSRRKRIEKKFDIVFQQIINLLLKKLLFEVVIHGTKFLKFNEIKKLDYGF